MIVSILLCAVLVGIDQFLSHWAATSLAPVGAVPFIPGVMELYYVENDGSAFNLFSGMQVFLVIFTGLVLLAGAFILLFRRPKDKLMYISILMVFSGGLGNWIDRVARGYVVDYFATTFINFAVFNFADILVCVGFALLVVAFIREELQQKKLKNTQPSVAAAQTKSDDAED